MLLSFDSSYTYTDKNHWHGWLKKDVTSVTNQLVGYMTSANNHLVGYMTYYDLSSYQNLVGVYKPLLFNYFICTDDIIYDFLTITFYILIMYRYSHL